MLNEIGISEAGKLKKWISARNALTQLLVGIPRVFVFFGRCCVILHCHQQLWSKQIICTSLELGKDFMWWGRKNFAVNWATCGTIPRGWGFPRKTNRSVLGLNKNEAKKRETEGLKSSEGLFESGIVAVGCSATICSGFAAGFQWSGGHQGGDDAAKHQHFKIKPVTVRSQLLWKLHISSAQNTGLRSIAGNKSGGCSYSESSCLFGLNEILLKHCSTCCL